MRILITGANGYIGKSLNSALKDKYDVTAVSRSNFDLTNPVAISKFFASRKNFDVVIHCAAAGGSRLVSDTWEVADTNLIMYYNLVQYHNKNYAKLIHFGSGAEVHAPNEPYGFSKVVIKKSIQQRDGFYNFRIYGLFDENEAATRFIKAGIENYKNNNPIIVHENKLMDFFYMEDLVKLVDYYMTTSNPPKEIDCSYGDYLSLQELAAIINNLDEHKVDIKVETQNYKTSYVGTYTSLPLTYVGLIEGIKKTYNKIK